MPPTTSASAGRATRRSHASWRDSAVGYSGTNATGVVVRDSVWDRNGAGILPNSYANEAFPPEARTTIVGNTVIASGGLGCRSTPRWRAFLGIGIAVAGGNANAIRDNRVTRSERYGIAVFPTARFVSFSPGPEPGPPWRPRGNRTVRNVVSGSGWADLALAAGSGRANCFSGNRAAWTSPPRLQTSTCTGASPSAARVASILTRPVRVMVAETIARRRPPDYTAMPVPRPSRTCPSSGGARRSARTRHRRHLAAANEPRQYALASARTSRSGGCIPAPA